MCRRNHKGKKMQHEKIEITVTVKRTKSKAKRTSIHGFDEALKVLSREQQAELIRKLLEKLK